MVIIGSLLGLGVGISGFLYVFGIPLYKDYKACCKRFSDKKIILINNMNIHSHLLKNNKEICIFNKTTKIPNEIKKLIISYITNNNYIYTRDQFMQIKREINYESNIYALRLHPNYYKQ